jgi:hypothetical protein
MNLFRNAFVLIGISIVSFGCGPSVPSNANSNSNVNANIAGKEIRLDPANMPAGLSANSIPPSANLPPGISLNANVPPSTNKTPGIPSAEELKKPFKPGKNPTPGIPDPATIRKQMGYPTTNANLPDAPTMKSNKK